MGRNFEATSYDSIPPLLVQDLSHPELIPQIFEDLPWQEWPAQWHPSSAFPTPQSANTNEFRQLANAAHSFSKTPEHYRLGDPALPVALYREHYLQVEASSQNVVVSSETGSGKSSQLGLYLLEKGVPRIFVTQPRILAARELMERARHSLGPDHQHLAGYLTGNADDSDCGPDARLIYVTEQLLFKMINRGALQSGDRIVSDEAHERTVAMVLLLGLIKEVQQDIPDIHQTISSASIDTDRFAKYLADPQTGEPAPVMILPGRTYPITRLDTEDGVAPTMRDYMGRGRNVLAFEPGVSRMRTTWAKAQSRKNSHTIHMLYGDQSPAEQKEALNPDDKNHIVATRIGETSITPQGKDVVVDSGLSNVGRYVRGVRGLETVFSSKDTMLQRSGRVGRTKPGTYVLAVPADAPPPPAYEDRPDYEPPSIQNSSVTSYIAELQRQGRRLEHLNLFEDPTQENLQHDYLVLQRLGATALAGKEVVLTEIGEAMTDLSLDAPLARMVVEARMLASEMASEREGEALRLQVVAATAVQQVRGILDGNQTRQNSRRRAHKESLSSEQSSDVLFELDVFTVLYAKQQEIMASGAADVETRVERLLATNDVLPSRYVKAVRTYEELCRREELAPQDLQVATAVQRSLIIGCQIAGAEEVFVRRSKKLHIDIRGEQRILGRKSTIAAPLAQLAIGVAFNLDSMRSSGRYPRRFIAGASVVTLEQLRAHAPHRLSESSSGYVISKNGSFVEKKSYFFDGELKVGETEESPAPTLAARTALITAMMTGMGQSTHNPVDTAPYNPGTPNATAAAQQWRAAQKLEHRSGITLNTVKRYESLIKKVVRQSVEILPLDVTDPAELDKLIPKVYMSSLVRPTRRKDLPDIFRRSPDGISVHINDEEKEYIPVSYKNNIAYVTISRDQQFSIQRSDFDRLLEHHDVKLRIGAGKYMQLETAFERIDEMREAQAVKRERRERNRELSAAAVSADHTASVERERPPQQLDVQEAKVKSLNGRIPAQRRRHVSGKYLARSIGDAND